MGLSNKAGLSPRWSWMLGAAAAYNLVVAVPAIALPGTAQGDRITAVLVASFGVLYALIARAPALYGRMLWAGVLGKAGILAILLPAVLDGRAPGATGYILAGDALFTIGFLALLLGPQRRHLA
jgi:hypothetical protein